MKTLKKLLVIAGILAITAAVAACGSSQNSDTQSEAAISQDKAIEIALSNVDGASEEEVTSVSFDKEENEYEVDITHKGYEYSFEISAADGTVLSSEKEKAETSSNEDESNLIGKDKAISIALDNVDGAKESDVTEAYKEYDDGVYVYEITIVYNEYEYEFEIDAESGNILSKDSESVYED